jgi:hypothetical protein
MPRMLPEGVTLVATLLSAAHAAWAVAQPPAHVGGSPAEAPAEAPAEDRVLAEARARVGELSIERGVGDDIWEAAAACAEPLLLFEEPTRDNEAGSVWIWGRSGRPLAIMELYQYGPRDGDWCYVLCNVSAGEVRGQRLARPWWRANRSDVAFQPIAGAAPAAATDRARLRQARELARRFQAHQYWDPDNSRFELRLLPQPLHRYADAEAGIVDGALFVLANGTNPEVVLLLEATAGAGESAEWRFAAARLGHAEMHLLLDDGEAWTAPRVAELPPDSPYWLEYDPAGP